MKTFRANHGTVFHYHEDLGGEITLQVPGREAAAGANTTRLPLRTVGVSAEDFMQFAAHVAGLPPWQPEKDAFDRQTTELMLAHVENCPDCNLETRCSKYWTLILERVREKERRAKN